MKTDHVTLNQYWADLIIEELVRSGINYFCLGPGSRSTPLVVAAARHSAVELLVCPDERSLGFHALGYGRAQGSPAAVITTSGTAVANLYPAVVEASAGHVPIVLLTADRPPELIDCGANQTIQQNRFFGNYVRWHADLPCPDSNISPTMLLTTVDQAVYRSKTGSPGPVHLNCRYREPLEPSTAAPPTESNPHLQAWQDNRTPFTRYSKPQQILPQSQLQALTELIENTDRGMIIAGHLTSPAQRESLLKLARTTQWTTYADICSGLRFSSLPLHPLRYYDQQLLSAPFNQHVKPEVVLHFGGPTTSKRLWQYFDQHRPQRYLVVKETPHRYDPAHYVTDHLQADLVTACRNLSEGLTCRPRGSFAAFFQAQAPPIDALIDQMIQEADVLTEPFVSRSISEMIPESTCLFLSNSMPVRDMDLYARTIDKPVLVGTNRGVSGIDGIVSTATGFAAGHQKMLTLVIGDLAMLHDLNALSLLPKVNLPIVIVVINNQGGGIFDFLPIAQYPDVFEPYFVAPHDFNLAGACQTFKIPYTPTHDRKTFTQSYQAAVTEKRTTLIEVFTNRQANLKLRKQIKSRILQLLQSEIR